MVKFSVIASFIVLALVLFARDNVKELFDSIKDLARMMRKEEWIIFVFAQLAAIVLIHFLYDQFAYPLYTAFLGRGRDGITRYGAWGVIIADFGENFSLVREYAHSLISNNMNVCFVDIGEGDQNVLCSDGNSIDTDEAIDILVRELNLKSRERKTIETSLKNSFDSSSSDEGDNDTQLRVHVVRYRHCSDEATCDDKMDKRTNSSIPTFSATLTSMLGQMTNSGGVGISINCCSRRHAKTVAITNKTNRFLSSVQSIIHYMMFREIGAVIDVIDTSAKSDVQGSVSTARKATESTFTSQVIESMRHEYKAHGIDSLSVSLSSNCISQNGRIFGWKPDPKVVVATSFRMLGLKSEMTLSDCHFFQVIDMIFS